MVPRGANSCKKPKIVERHDQIRNQRTGDTKGGLRKRDRGSHYGQNPLLAIATLEAQKWKVRGAQPPRVKLEFGWESEALTTLLHIWRSFGVL
jgi:hypothetical protein